jgi:flagellar hook-associated protein 1 FlgK
MSINSILGSARLALITHQAAMETTSHNIANVETPGYTRQRALLQANIPLATPRGALGTGVILTDVARTRDNVLDSNFRRQSSTAGSYATRNEILSSVSDVYGEPSDTGLASTLDQFWNAWGDLANAPTSVAAKSVVQQRGNQLATTLNRYAEELNNASIATRGKLDNAVDNINKYARQIAALNEQIVAGESDGHTAPDLRDARDMLLDQMSAIVPTQIVERGDGSVAVYVGNMTVADGSHSRTLTVDDSGGAIRLKIDGSTVSSTGGSLGAMMDALTTDIPAQKTQLDTLTQQIVSTVNTLHRSGWSAAGDALGGANWNAGAPPTGSNVNFFDPALTSAANITLSATVKADASTVAAGDVQNATGNNSLATKMAQLRTNTTSILKYGSTTQTTSLGEYYRDMVTRLGANANAADSASSVYSTLAQQADALRQSANGVSTDEELIAMTKHQQAYSAAARVVTMADDMAQTLLDMVR